MIIRKHRAASRVISNLIAEKEADQQLKGDNGHHLKLPKAWHTGHPSKIQRPNREELERDLELLRNLLGKKYGKHLSLIIEEVERSFASQAIKGTSLKLKQKC